MKKYIDPFQEDLRARPEEALKRCFNFLGVAPNVCSPEKQEPKIEAPDKYYDITPDASGNCGNQVLR